MLLNTKVSMGMVSIITPNYNNYKYIHATIESVIAQTYQNWELLIQDDFSSDGSYEIALSFQQLDSRIKVERNSQNLGAAETRNNALRRASGEWIAFLDADDIWSPDKLEKQISWMCNNKCDFSFTEYEHIDDEGNPLFIKAKAKKHVNYTQMLFHCWTGCLTVVYKNEGEIILGPNVKNNNDYALFLKVLKHKKNAMGIPECLAFYRLRKKSISRNKFNKIKPLIEVLHTHEGHNIVLCYLFLCTNVLIKLLWKYKKLSISKLQHESIN